MGSNAKPLAKGVRSNMSDPAGQEIRRQWGDLPVVDAKKNLRVFMIPEDVSKATKKDPAYCVFAQACRRQFHATKVMFWRSVAYIELPDAKGKRRVERFIMPDSMRDLIESFDQGKGIIPEGGFELCAPTEHRTLDSLAEKSRDQHSRKPRRKIIGTKTGVGRGKGKFRDGAITIDLAVRSGTGAVHFGKPTMKRVESSSPKSK